MRSGQLRPFLSRWMAACLLACTGAAHAALQLQPVEGGLTEPQRAATRQLLDEAAARLPASWTASLDRRIALEWRDDLPDQGADQFRLCIEEVRNRKPGCTIEVPSDEPAGTYGVAVHSATFPIRSAAWHSLTSPAAEPVGAGP